MRFTAAVHHSVDMPSAEECVNLERNTVLEFIARFGMEDAVAELGVSAEQLRKKYKLPG